MTQQTVDSLSPDLSWAESNLPPAVEEPNLSPDDATHLVNPPKNACPTCGEEVVREPGSRGRVPKYHPECKPIKGTRSSSGPRAVRVLAKDRADAEAVEMALDRARNGLAKAVMLLSLADPYDALVVNVNSEDLLAHLRVLLMRFPKLRETAGDTTTVASFVGLAVTVASMALPILAHHKLIPGNKFRDIFLQIPLFMMRMQEQMANIDPTAMNESLKDQVIAKARAAREAARLREQSEGESVNASPAR